MVLENFPVMTQPIHPGSAAENPGMRKPQDTSSILLLSMRGNTRRGGKLTHGFK